MYTDEIQEQCDATCAKFNLPKLDEPCIVEGTITNDGAAPSEKKGTTDLASKRDSAEVVNIEPNQLNENVAVDVAKF